MFYYVSFGNSIYSFLLDTYLGLELQSYVDVYVQLYAVFCCSDTASIFQNNYKFILISSGSENSECPKSSQS